MISISLFGFGVPFWRMYVPIARRASCSVTALYAQIFHSTRLAVSLISVATVGIAFMGIPFVGRFEVRSTLSIVCGCPPYVRLRRTAKPITPTSSQTCIQEMPYEH